MASNYETFWQKGSYAFVGHSEKRNFPKISFTNFRKNGGTAYAIDPSVEEIEGEKAYSDFPELPTQVEAAVLEVPKAETKEWVEKAASAGIKDLWIHMGTDTPEALAIAKEKGIDVRHGTCAVMYVTPGFTYHSIHKSIMKMIGKY